MATKTQIYQIKVTLKGSKPPIWRRLLVSSAMSLAELHYVLQTAMGWEGGHLHQFFAHDQYFGVPEPEFDMDVLDESRYTLEQMLPQEKASMIYEYDFGDGWEHKIVAEKILPPDPKIALPTCVKGKRACPPEDVGGVWGYADFLEAIKDPKHPEHEDFLEWIGDDFDPEYFDVDEVNEVLAG